MKILSTMKLRYVPLFIISSVIGLNCAPANGPLSNQQAIMPLAVGNEWIGQVTQYDSYGNSDSIWFDTLRVLKSEVVAGEIWYDMNAFWINGSDTNRQWFANRSDGLYTCDSEYFREAYRFGKYPAKPGDVCVTFENTFDSTRLYGQSDGISVDTTDLLVTVPAGQFRCYVYRGFSISRDYDVVSSAFEPGQYYAPGVGLIASGYFGPDGQHDKYIGLDRTWRLVRAILH
jgi:hypothetical protein